MAGPCCILFLPTSNTWSGWPRRKRRPAQLARAFGRRAGPTVLLVNSAGITASADLDRLHHPVDEMWLTVLRVGNEADETIISRGEIGGERAPASLIQKGHPTQRLGRRRALHRLSPFSEIFGFLAGGQLQEHHLVWLGAAILDQNGVPAGRKGLREREGVVRQGHGDITMGCVRRGGRGAGGHLEGVN